MSESTPAPRRAPLLPPLLAILLAVVGTTIMLWTFAAIVELALGGDGSLAARVLFFAGAALDLAALAIALVGIVRDRRRGLSWVALAFALVPIALVALVAVAANAGL